MNTVNRTIKTVAAKFSFAAIALTTALALMPAPAQADLLITQIRTPSQQVGVPANQQALQFYVFNTYPMMVLNQYVSVSLQTWADGPTSRAFSVYSSAFSLPAYSAKWITLVLPKTAAGQSLVGQELKGYASLHAHSYYLDFNDNGAVNSGGGNTGKPDLEIGTVVTPSTQKEGAAFTVQVINKGTAASAAATLSVTLTPWEDGPVGSSYTQQASIPILQAGQSYTVTFHAHDEDGAGNQGTITLGTHSQQISFWN